MTIGKFSFKYNKEANEFHIQMIYNDSFKAVHKADTLECVKCTMPSFLQDEYMGTLRTYAPKLMNKE